MKRILCVLLSLVLSLSVLAGCSKDSQEPESGDPLAGVFSVGYGKADISPEQSVYLRGYGDPKEERMSTGVAERLYATCVAITDAKGNTVLLAANDLIGANTNAGEPLRKAISQETGLPIDNIMICCSHNHSAPDMGDPVYAQLMTKRFLEAAVAALADRKPATMETTFSRPEGYNFNRHYLLIDGTYQGEAVGTVPKDQVYGHFAKADNLLQVVRFNREGDKPVVLMNWQGHPRGTDPNPHTVATCNYPGVMRATVEEALDCYGAFFLSGSGNMNNNSQIKSEVKHANYMELGTALGQEVVAAAENFEPANTGDIQIAVSYLNTDGVEAESGAPYYAMSFGDVAFAFAPNEIFDTNAMAVKNNSKFKMTFYSSCSNASHGYLPTDPSFDWVQHYEVRITKYPKGTALVVQNMLSALLDECFEAGGNVETEKKEGYITPPFEPASDGVTYLNPVPGDADSYILVNNGFCQVVLMNTETNAIKKYLALNEDVAKEILQRDTMKLLFNDQYVITEVVK